MGFTSLAIDNLFLLSAVPLAALIVVSFIYLIARSSEILVRSRLRRLNASHTEAPDDLNV